MNVRSRNGKSLSARRTSVVACAGTVALCTGLAGPTTAAGSPTTAAAVPKAAAVQEAAADPARPLACPAVQPVAAVRVGQHGTGFTVTRGTTPRAFDVEVLGVLPDGIAPGRDLVLIEVADKPGLPPVIAQGGGIWAGMSGSPVYMGDRLLGAVSYGFTLSPSPIGGLTPAEDMVKLLPAATGKAATSGADERLSATMAQDLPQVALPERVRDDITARTGAAVPAAAMEPLKMPLGVSGLSGKRLGQVQDVADRAGLSVLAHPAGGAALAAAPGPMATPQAGGNFAAVASYGDVTLAGIGTTTAVCGGHALAFGHPFTFSGRTAFGANAATSAAIVRDDTLGSFKLATVGRLYGTLDADRLAGVRARLGAAPALTPITSAITSTELGTTLRGRTDATDQRFLALSTFFHVAASFDSAFDRVGPAHSATTWQITGTRAGGRTFTLKRVNRWSSQTDTGGLPAAEVATAEDTLLNNEFEAVRITGVKFDANASPGLDQETLVQRLVAVNDGAFRERDGVTVQAGARLRVRAVLRPYRKPTRTVDFALTVPAGTAPGQLLITSTAGNAQAGPGSGGPPADCLLQPDGGCATDQSARSFDELLAQLRSIPQNNALTVELVPVDETGVTAAPVAKGTKLQPRVVTGAVAPVVVTVR